MNMAGPRGEGGSREPYPQLDLTGKLIIKMQLGDDIRRIPIHNEDITYDELVLMMQRVFRERLDSKDEITIKYRDEDDDLITISDSSELSFAIQCSRILRLVLFVNSLPRPLEGDEVKHIRKELQAIRNRVNTLLDHLEPPAAAGAILNGSLDTDVAMTAASPASVPSAKVAANISDSKEFDPLSQKTEDSSQNKVMSAFGINSEASHRPTSPAESTSSIGSSASNQVRTGQQQPNALPGQPPHQHPTSQPQQQQFSAPQQPGYPGYHHSPQQQAKQMHPGQPGYTGQPQQQQQQQPQQPGYPQPTQQDPSAAQQYPYGAPGQQQVAPGQPGQYPNSSMSQQQQYAQQNQAYQQPQYSQASGAHQQQQQPQYAGYPQPGQGPPQSNASPGNPYSRGPSYGQYPRPQGQYPQPGYQQ